MKHKGKGHTGDIHNKHAPMPKGHGGQDPMAHESHKAANKEHGTGMSPEDGYTGGADEHGGEGMGSNCCEED